MGQVMCLEQVACLGEEMCLGEEELCVDERWLSCSQKNKKYHEPKEELGLNEWTGQKKDVSQIGAG